MSSNITPNINPNTIRLFSLSEKTLQDLGFRQDEAGGIWMGSNHIAERMCEISNEEMASIQQKAHDDRVMQIMAAQQAPDEPVTIAGHTQPEETCPVCHPAKPVVEDEPEGTLLTNEVIAELIQCVGAMRKRIEDLEAKLSTDEFASAVREVVDDMDLFDESSFDDKMEEVYNTEDFGNAVRNIVDEMSFEDEIERVVNDMDLSEKVGNQLERMDIESVVTQALDHTQCHLKIEGTNEEGKLMVTMTF